MIKRWLVRFILGVGKGQVHCPCCGRFMGRQKKIVVHKPLASWDDYLKEHTFLDRLLLKPKLEIAESQLSHPQFVKTEMELKNNTEKENQDGPPTQEQGN